MSVKQVISLLHSHLRRRLFLICSRNHEAEVSFFFYKVLFPVDQGVRRGQGWLFLPHLTLREEGRDGVRENSWCGMSSYPV